MFKRSELPRNRRYKILNNGQRAPLVCPVETFAIWNVLMISVGTETSIGLPVYCEVHVNASR